MDEIAKEELKRDLPNAIKWEYNLLYYWLLGWHERWSRRPSREQIHNVLRKHEVSREEIGLVIKKHGGFYGPPPRGDSETPEYSGLVNDLLALLNDKEEPKVWCSDIQWKDGWAIRVHPEEGSAVWLRGIGGLNVNDFKVCPLCCAPRPESGA